MSDNDVCGKPLCRQIRRAHVWTNHTIAHAFVEPVPAPQPPADATSPNDKCAGTCVDGGLCGYVRRAHGKELGQIGHRFVEPKPDDPPVTGDGDAAELDRLVEDAVMSMNVRPYHSTRQAMDNLAYEAYAAGIARGRALGAREERADIIRDAHESHCYCCPGRPRCPICEFADAIARRAGRGTP